MKVGLLAATAVVALLPLAFAAADEQRFSAATSETYSHLVFSHLQQYKGPYPASAYGASGTVTVRFVLEREGDVVSGTILKSSRNGTLDREALAIVGRASPFPRFPANMPGSKAAFAAPFYFQPVSGGRLPARHDGQNARRPNASLPVAPFRQGIHEVSCWLLPNSPRDEMMSAIGG